MVEKRSKYDTDPLDPEFVRRTEEIAGKTREIVLFRLETDVGALAVVDLPGYGFAQVSRRERAAYEWMASHLPTHVIRLNVDAETALARKPNHARGLIEKKVAATPQLTFNGAPIVDLDATMPYEQELALAKAAITNALR